MNRDFTKLAKIVADLPGFTWRSGAQSMWSQPPQHGGNRTTFDAGNGCAYTSPSFQPDRGRWTCDGPNLAHAGTAGVLLSMLGPYTLAYNGTVYEVTVWGCPPTPAGRVFVQDQPDIKGLPCWSVTSEILGVALGLCLVAIGQCAPLKPPQGRVDHATQAGRVAAAGIQDRRNEALAASGGEWEATRLGYAEGSAERAAFIEAFEASLRDVR